MKVSELNREQLAQLKVFYFTNEIDPNPSYMELSEIDNIVSDETVTEYFEGVKFTEDDFLN